MKDPGINRGSVVLLYPKPVSGHFLILQLTEPVVMLTHGLHVILLCLFCARFQMPEVEGRKQVSLVGVTVR